MFICSLARIRERLQFWRTDTRNTTPQLGPMCGFSNQNPVKLMYKALSTCHDRNPALATHELEFITPIDFRDDLRRDITEIDVSLANGEWKSATVLAGSTIEALLLWDLQNRRPEPVRKQASTDAIASGALNAPPKPNLEDWVLHQYIEVSAAIPTIEKETAIEARLAKDFRNLIHPGRAQRLAQKCDRGTAHASFAALDHVARDLSR